MSDPKSADCRLGCVDFDIFICFAVKKQNRFAKLSGDDTVSVLPQGLYVPQAKKVGPHHRRRTRVRNEGSDPEHLTLLDSS